MTDLKPKLGLLQALDRTVLSRGFLIAQTFGGLLWILVRMYGTEPPNYKWGSGRSWSYLHV